MTPRESAAPLRRLTSSSVDMHRRESCAYIGAQRTTDHRRSASKWPPGAPQIASYEHQGPELLGSEEFLGSEGFLGSEEFLGSAEFPGSAEFLEFEERLGFEEWR